MAKRAPLPDWIAEHLALYKSDPEKAHIWNGTPSLLLTTTGRVSGDPLQLPLFYGKQGDSVVVVASKGGTPNHPDWYSNLVQEPTVEVQVEKDKFTGKARTAEGDERAKLWDEMAKIWPAYNDYQANTTRKIPVVVIDRA